ncbi:MAG: PQQ-binding-like beta-propeller repeat protein [Planctomycetes bacterium]|nr:PQQ-binding-like beta-propeller repeat protein [Planctomycetota bacterium]
MRSFDVGRRGILVAVLLGIPLARIAAEDWPQFRGPNCTGVSLSKKALPIIFSRTKNVRWSALLGDGIGSPVVAAGRVFSTGMANPKGGEQKLVVYAFDAQTGKKLWQRDIPAGVKPLPAIHEVNSYASASPAADAERVYVYFSRTGLTAFDAKTGAQAWHMPLPEPFFIFDWGAGMSPVLYQDTLFFCQDDDVFPALYAVNKKTGKLLWKDDRSDMAAGYSHPVICQTPKGPELVVAGTGKVLGYNLITGKRMWAAELDCRNIKTTPVSHDGVVYVSVSSTGISYQWRATADPKGTGKITRESIKASRKDKGAGIPEAFWKKFERGDLNKDGVLEGEEIDRAFLDPSNQGGILDRESLRRAGNQADWRKWDAALQTDSSFQAVKGGGKGDVTKTHLLWKHKSKAPDGLVSPLLLGDRLVLIKSGGFANVFSANKGLRLADQHRIGIAGALLAQPVYGDGKIYVTGKNGQIVVLAPGPELKVLTTNDMGEDCIATPAIADGRLYIRTRTNLFCIGDAPRQSQSER